MQLQAAANTSTVSSNNQSNNVGAGVTFGVGQQSGISFQLSASQAQGRANGTETLFDNTRITASNTLTVKSGADTTLAGAQLAADQVKMEVGTSGTGKLNIQTLQDSSTYQSEQSSSGFSVSVCLPPLCVGGVPVTGNIQQSEQAFDHNYQSAVGQSGIAAGSGGFDIKVAGNTDLTGAAITSTATPDKNSLSTASLTSTDLDNRQSTHSSSSSTSVGYSGASPLATLAQNVVSNGLGNLGGGAGLPENGSQSSKTQSVISAGNIVITGTGDSTRDTNSQQQVATLTSRDASTANQTLSNTLTLQQAQAVQEQQKTAQENAQAGQLVGSVAFNVVGDIAQKNGWENSSPQKIALHAIAGFIQASAAGQNGATGALAAMGNEALTKVVNEAIDKALPMPENATPEQQREVSLSRKALAESAASLLGATTVALAGGSNQQIALGGAVALNADRFNRQLHPKEREWLAENKSKVAKEARASNPMAFAGFSDEQVIALVDKFAITNLDAAATESLLKQYGWAAGPAMLAIRNTLLNDTQGMVITDAGYALQMFTNTTVGRGGQTNNIDFYNNSSMYSQYLPTTAQGIAEFSKLYGYAPPLSQTQFADLDPQAKAAYGTAVTTQGLKDTGGVGGAVTKVLEAVGQAGAIGIVPGGTAATGTTRASNGPDNWVANEGAANSGANGGGTAIRNGGTVELFTDASGPKVPGAVGVGPTDPGAIAKNAMSMPNIPSGSQAIVVANNPYIPKAAGGTFSMMDYLPEASRITKIGGEIVINGNGPNKYFSNMPTATELDAMGLTIKYQGPLLPEYKGMSFTTTQGKPIDIDTMQSIVFVKKAGSP